MFTTYTRCPECHVRVEDSYVKEHSDWHSGLTDATERISGLTDATERISTDLTALWGALDDHAAHNA